MTWYRCGVDITRIPTILKAESRNRGSGVQTFTYTFTESGTFQYILGLGYDLQGTNVTYKLNDTDLTPQSLVYSNLMSIYYESIAVSADDVLTITVPQAENLGAQFFVLKNADISNISIVGFGGNDNSTFDIALPFKTPFIEVCGTGYYQSNNNFNYILGVATQPSFKSIPTLSSVGSYFWGYTYVITI